MVFAISGQKMQVDRGIGFMNERTASEYLARHLLQARSSVWREIRHDL